MSALVQAAALTLLLPQDAEGKLGPVSRRVAATCGGGNGSRSRTSGGVTRRQLLSCVAPFYAAQLTPEAHEAAMQVHLGRMLDCTVLRGVHVHAPGNSCCPRCC